MTERFAARLYNRAIRSAAGTRFGRAVGDRVAAQRVASASAEQDELLNKARRQRDKGKRGVALQLFRRAATQGPASAEAWRLYARELVETGHPEASFEAVKTALELDPSHVDTLELYLELHRRAGASTKRRRQVIGAFGQHVVKRPHRLGEAYDYAAQFSLPSVIDDMRTAPSPMARALAQLHLVAERGADDEELRREASRIAAEESVDPSVLLLRVALARGRRQVIRSLLPKLDAERLPLASLRRAIRRERANGKLERARPLIEAFLRGKPEDSWARGLLQEIERLHTASVVGQEQTRLVQHGFPVPERQEPSTEADPRTVLYLLHNSLPYSSAGYATRTHGLLTGLTGQGWSMHGVTRPAFPYDRATGVSREDIPEVDRIDGVPYHRLSTSFEKLSRRPLVPYVEAYEDRVVELASHVRPGAIHAASNHWNGLAAARAARRLGLPSIYEVRGLWEITRISREPQWHDSDEYRFMAAMEADAAKAADAVFALTRALKQEMVDRGVDADKIVILPNGVDASRFQPRAADDGLRRQLGLPDVPVVGYVGSILDYEGIDVLLRAARHLADRRASFHVLVVGDGDFLPRARQLSAELGLGPHVTFTGRVPHDQVERYYSLIDIAPLPRKSLPVTEMVSPLKPFEAMAMGKVVVGSDVDAIAEIIQNDVNGLLFRKDDAESLADVLEDILENESRRKSIAKQARAWVIRERSWTKIARIAEAVYGRLGIGGELVGER
ncbi:glycosyltransferase [Isoptericola sp. F-RaC21]|uniref:glycosyltransferase n=1 Tax=Isoptericola sp. F-RaC21 TaxID=3141452 RepID=UPI00315C35D8